MYSYVIEALDEADSAVFVEWEEADVYATLMNQKRPVGEDGCGYTTIHQFNSLSSLAMKFPKLALEVLKKTKLN